MEVAMAFREVRVYEVKEVLRLWLRGKGTRPIAALVGLDRKTVQRYIAAAAEAGFDRSAGEDSLDDGLLAQVCERVRPHRLNDSSGYFNNRRVVKGASRRQPLGADADAEPSTHCAANSTASARWARTSPITGHPVIALSEPGGARAVPPDAPRPMHSGRRAAWPDVALKKSGPGDHLARRARG
jgi:hypothetical protein